MKNNFAALAFALLVADAQSQPANSILSDRGMWLQKPDSFRVATVPRLQAMGVKRVHVMGTHAVAASKVCRPFTLKPTASIQELVSVADQLRQGSISRILTLYVAPHKDSIDALTDPQTGLVAKLLGAGFQAIEYDLEGGWSNSVVCGFTTHNEAVQYLFARTKALQSNVPIGVTTHLGRARDPNIGLDRADWLSIQVYTKCATSCPAFNDLREGPGHRQARTPAAVTFKGPVIVGLAAYHQKWPARSEEEAMVKALEATLMLQKNHLNYVGHSYWSTSWVPEGSPQWNFLNRTANLKAN